MRYSGQCRRHVVSERRDERKRDRVRVRVETAFYRFQVKCFKEIRWIWLLGSFFSCCCCCFQIYFIIFHLCSFYCGAIFFCFISINRKWVDVSYTIASEPEWWRQTIQRCLSRVVECFFFYFCSKVNPNHRKLNKTSWKAFCVSSPLGIFPFHIHTLLPFRSQCIHKIFSFFFLHFVLFFRRFQLMCVCVYIFIWFLSSHPQNITRKHTA